LSYWEQLDLEYGPDDHRPGFRDEDERRAAWIQHRHWLMARCKFGWRPDGWWSFESTVPRPDDYERERALLWEHNLLSPEERAELETEWREEFEHAQTPDFTCCIGPSKWLAGPAARRAAYRSASIPHALIRKWTKERRCRERTIPKPVAEPV
jgi:hypothetical protein